MGKSMPPPASFDLVDSVARLRGSTAEVRLARPEISDLTDGARFRFARGKLAVEAPGELSGSDNDRAVVVKIRRADLQDGVWSIAVLDDAGEPRQRLQARLLVQGARPLVLLWGAKGNDAVRPVGTNTASRRVAASGGRLLDQALSTLPTHHAVSLRRTARAAARRTAGRLTGR